MLAFALSAFSAVFSVVDPLGVVPVYLAMTAADSREHKRRTAVRASIAMFVTLAVFAASGRYILSFFGISLGAFRMAGGVLLLLLAIDMLRAQKSRQKSTPEEEAEAVEKPDVSIFPLAIPMLSGPGAVATVMVLMTRAQGLLQMGIVFIAIGITAIITFVVLLGATFAEKRLGQTGINVLHRVMGLLLAAIAIQFIVDGARDVLPEFLAAIKTS
jgi:multiple antibiotic resistance protein